jgi:hypothetical protein
MNEEKKLLEELVLGLVKENHKLAKTNEELKKTNEELKGLLKKGTNADLIKGLTLH